MRLGSGLSLCLTHHEQTFCQSPPDLRPQKGAEEEEGGFGPGDVRVLPESPFGELQPAVATVSPRVQHDTRGSANELQVSWHGLHFHRPRAAGVTAHRGAAQRTKPEGRAESRERRKSRLCG